MILRSFNHFRCLLVVHVRSRASMSGSGGTKLHWKCVNNVYLGDVQRSNLNPEQVCWENDVPEYTPTDYTAKFVHGAPWADLDFSTAPPEHPPNWNQRDGKVNRASFTGKYQTIEGLPRNPIGRTGMKGRGSLGRWGPNHAADPVVTRWQRDAAGNKEVHPKSGKSVLQFVAIKRKDTGEWAIPGGMVDAGEQLSVTLKREFGEEALASMEVTPERKVELDKQLNSFFKRGVEIYKGYVDDPRNTDNAWMETIAVNFHDEAGNVVGAFDLHAGDDAVGVRWATLSSDLELYASHINFLEKVAQSDFRCPVRAFGDQ